MSHQRLFSIPAFLGRKTLGGILILIAILIITASPFFYLSDVDTVEVSVEVLERLEEIRDQTMQDPPPRLQVEVDYSEGESAAWWPRQEAPILEHLVSEGRLPPVQERVGPEPLVLRGVEGEGRYGGTLHTLNVVGGSRLLNANLVRWSPQGHPVVPHLAKSFEANEDFTVFTATLRRGVRWSDGHPFTSADVVYWWEAEQVDTTAVPGGPYIIFIHNGIPMEVRALDDYTVEFSFVEPYPLFPEFLASYWESTASPKHFMEQFHPVRGDPEKIQEVMNAHNLLNERMVYTLLRTQRVERPVLSPWVRRSERQTPPDVFVRNPYYWAVDTSGRQLPYVDRIVVDTKSTDMVTISAAQGEVSYQNHLIRLEDYSMLMRQREEYNYELKHWINGSGAEWSMSLNLNRRVEEGDAESADKAKLLGDKRFRQALSLAINRQDIVDALFPGMATPANIAAPAHSPFYDPDFEDRFAAFDLEKANRLLDEVGLTERDRDGFRRFPGGPSLLFDMNFSDNMGEGPGQFILDDWRRIGINARMRLQARSIFYVQKAAGLHDISVWGGYGSFLPYLDPRYYFPFNHESNFAVRHGIWYAAGGLFRPDDPEIPGSPPDPDSPLKKAMWIFEEVKQAPTLEERIHLFHQIRDLAAENVHHISLQTPLPALTVIKNGFRNVPLQMVFSWEFLSPSNAKPETWFWEEGELSAVAFRETLSEIQNVTPVRPLFPTGRFRDQTQESGGILWVDLFSVLIKWGLLLGVILLAALAAIRSPFVARRFMIMGPMLFVISIISFIVIDLPPGDGITARIIQMEEEGGTVDPAMIEELRTMFRTEEPMWRRYTWWMGFDWFLTFDRRDQGLLQGNMGRSMVDLGPVNEKVGDRLLFTVLISLGTILFTWFVALPIGIYSAVRQYSVFDYVFTVIGFLGMCIPGFLLALLMMFAAESMFGLNVSGLFSPEYAAQQHWTWGKIWDLITHIWLPVFVMGVTGTAGMIRVMRANLLDELGKPYVVTARAKGVPPLKLLLKYPVRIALNPFISGIGGIFPELISGAAIVSIVLSLPTIGPMQLEAVMQQDMYLAGSLLLLLALLSVIGTLVSDLLLAALDPRIRFQGGSK